MSHLDEVIARVDAAIEESVIAHMNELLIALSDDAELSREDRYTQQQRLRTLTLAPVAGAFDDALQLGAAVVVELEGLSCGHGLACFGVGRRQCNWAPDGWILWQITFC